MFLIIYESFFCELLCLLLRYLLCLIRVMEWVNQFLVTLHLNNQKENVGKIYLLVFTGENLVCVLVYNASSLVLFYYADILKQTTQKGCHTRMHLLPCVLQWSKPVGPSTLCWFSLWDAVALELWDIHQCPAQDRSLQAHHFKEERQKLNLTAHNFALHTVLPG